MVFILAFSSLRVRALTTFMAVPLLHVNGRPSFVIPMASMPNGDAAHGKVAILLCVMGRIVRSGKGQITTVTLLRMSMGSCAMLRWMYGALCTEFISLRCQNLSSFHPCFGWAVW